MIDVSFSLEGVEIVQRRLTGLAERAADPISPVADELDRVFMGLMADAFSSEGASTAAGAWAPLTPSTIADRARKGYGPAPILQRTGRLYRSLALRTGDTISVHAPMYWARGSAVPYFRPHQSNQPRTKLPRRAVIDLTDAQKQALIRPIAVYLTGKRASITLPGRGRPSTEG